MNDDAVLLITLGMLLLLAVAVYIVNRKLHVPQVTLLILSGVLIGPSGLDILPHGSREWYPHIAIVALIMVGFLLGGRLSATVMRKFGREILSVSVCKVLGVAALVFAGLLAIGAPPTTAILLAGIAPATALAAILSIVQETKAKGAFTETLVSAVAIDDAWGLAFSPSCWRWRAPSPGARTWGRTGARTGPSSARRPGISAGPW